MKLKVNISKVAIIAMFGVCALFNHAFAFKQEWFKADFIGFYLGSSFDVGWEAKGVMVEDVSNAESHFQDSKLYLEGDEVRLKIPSGRSAEGDNLLLTISSTVQCDGFDELPEPPLKKDGYVVAVAPMYGDSYYVLGYDEAGGTNRWFDSGIATISDRPVEFTVCLAYTNCENIAVYEFDGKRSEPVKIWDSGVSACEFVGCGVVSKCIGYDEEVAPMIPLKLPQIDGVRSRIDCKKDYGYPEEYITVYFDTDTMIPSRTSARFWVASDGRMVFADEGEYPYGVEIEATVNDVPYATLREALSVAGYYNTVRLMKDVQISGELEVNCWVFDLNGHSVDPVGPYDSIAFNVASVCSYCTDLWDPSAIHAIMQVNVSMYTVEQRVEFYEVVLGRPGVTLTTRVPVPYCRSFDPDRYELIEEVTYGGDWLYRLQEIVPPDVSAVLRPDERSDAATDVQADGDPSDFRIEGIRQESGKWVVTVTGGKRHGDRYGNGYVKIYKVDACGNPTDDPDARLFRAAIVSEPPSE